MMASTKVALMVAALIPVMLTLSHRDNPVASTPTPIVQTHDVRLGGVEALKLRIPFNDRFVAVQDRPPQPLPPQLEPKPIIIETEPPKIEAGHEPLKPHAVKVERTERIERHHHHQRDHDICRGHGRRYYHKHGWRYWHCRK